MLTNNSVEAIIGFGALTSPFLEGMNGALFMGKLCFFFVLIYYLWWATHFRLPISRWGDGNMLSALALAVYIFGEVAQRGWLWLWRYLINNGTPTGWMDNIPVVPLAVATIIFGLLWMIRRYTPQGWGNTAAAVSAALMVVFVFAT